MKTLGWIVLLLGCAAGVLPAQTSGSVDIVFRWLNCDECAPAHLQAVVDLGQQAVPMLTAALLKGPSAAVRASIRLSEQKCECVPFADPYLQTYTERYRAHAAIALGKLGGCQTESALRRALEREWPEQLRRTIREALEKVIQQGACVQSPEPR